MIVDLEKKTKNGTRWDISDREWLLEAADIIENDGFPSVAADLRKEIDKL
jgi:hypothetical protein